jgi:hypothetical protein
MPFSSQPGARVRRWIYAWLLLIAPAWALGLVADVEMLRWAKTTPDMCQGLPDFGATLPMLPHDGPIAFYADVAEAGNAERFFCAQYDLAPRVLVWWRPEFVDLSKRQLAGTTLVLNFSDHAARATFLRDLDAEARRQGAMVARRDVSWKLSVVTIQTVQAPGNG